MADANFWGSLVRQLREEQMITQRQLAAKTNVCRSTLRRIEAGLTSADMAVMERLLNFLGYELEAMEMTNLEGRLRRQMQWEDDPVRRSNLAVKRLMAIKSY